MKYCVGIDIARRKVIVKKLDYSNIWSSLNEHGWTYQSVFGAHVMAPMYETHSLMDVFGWLDKFLKIEPGYKIEIRR